MNKNVDIQLEEKHWYRSQLVLLSSTCKYYGVRDNREKKM